MRIIWHNGEFKSETEAKLSVYDSSLMWGDLVFEMMRTFNKETFKLYTHLDRLFTGLKILEINIPYMKNELFSAHEELLRRHIEAFPEEEEWRTLIDVSRGTLPLYQEMLGGGEPNIIITCFPLRYILKGKSKLYETGVKAIVPSQRAIPHHLLDARIKSRSRQHYKMANMEIERQDPEAWALLLDPDGFVAEGTGSNFFIVKGNDVITPKGRNCLRGVSRQTILDFGGREEDITLYDVYEADSAFFTCTPYSILPCTSINGSPIGDGRVGDVTKLLTKMWSEKVNCDFVKQIMRWDNCLTGSTLN